MLMLDLIAQIVKKQGVTDLFCYPTTPVIEAFARAGIRPILCRQERVGVDMANGYARIRNGSPFSVFAMQYGPGVENAYSGIASAYSDSSPILLLPLGNRRDVAQVTPSYRSCQNLQSVSRFGEEINLPQEVPNVLRRAISALINGRMGPAVVEIPRDMADIEVDIDPANFPEVKRARACPSDSDIDEAAALLVSAKAPIIQAGQGVLYAQASNELQELAELLSVPVLTTVEGKSAFPENHPLSLGTTGLVMTGHGQALWEEADLVLAVGSSLTRHAIVNRILPGGANRKKLIQLSNDVHDLAKGYEVDVPLLGDAQLGLRKLIEAVRDRIGTAKIDTARIGRIAQLKAQWLAQWQARLDSAETPISPYRVIREFMKATQPADTILTHDSGSPRDQILPFYEAVTPRSYLGWGQSHALGAGLGLTIGAKLADPSKFCVNFMGDAAFGMTGLDFETAVRVDAPICTVVLNNASMAIETKSMAYSHSAFRTRDIGGRYADIGRALGGVSERVDSPNDLRDAFKRAQEHTRNGRAVLLEIITSEETAFSHRAVL